MISDFGQKSVRFTATGPDQARSQPIGASVGGSFPHILLWLQNYFLTFVCILF